MTISSNAMKRRAFLRVWAAGIALAACGSSVQSGGAKTGGTATATPTPSPKAATKATVELVKGGSFSFTLRLDKAPQTVERFATTARDGFYNNLPFKTGAVGIARGADPKINNDSQWFIVKKDSDFLNGQYTNFGQLVTGLDVINGIKIGDRIKTITIE